MNFDNKMNEQMWRNDIQICPPIYFNQSSNNQGFPFHENTNDHSRFPAVTGPNLYYYPQSYRDFVWNSPMELGSFCPQFCQGSTRSFMQESARGRSCQKSIKHPQAKKIKEFPKRNYFQLHNFKDQNLQQTYCKTGFTTEEHIFNLTEGNEWKLESGLNYSTRIDSIPSNIITSTKHQSCQEAINHEFNPEAEVFSMGKANNGFNEPNCAPQSETIVRDYVRIIENQLLENHQQAEVLQDEQTSFQVNVSMDTTNDGVISQVQDNLLNKSFIDENLDIENKAHIPNLKVDANFSENSSAEVNIAQVGKEESFFLQRYEGKDENGRDVIIFLPCPKENENVLEFRDHTTQDGTIFVDKLEEEEACMQVEIPDQNCCMIASNREQESSNNIKIEFFSNLNDFVTEEIIDNTEESAKETLQLQNASKKRKRLRKSTANMKKVKKQKVQEPNMDNIYQNSASNQIMSHTNPNKSQVTKMQCLKRKKTGKKQTKQQLWKAKFMWKSNNLTLKTIQKMYFDEVLKQTMQVKKRHKHHLATKIMKTISQCLRNHFFSFMMDIHKTINENFEKILSLNNSQRNQLSYTI